MPFEPVNERKIFLAGSSRRLLAVAVGAGLFLAIINIGLEKTNKGILAAGHVVGVSALVVDETFETLAEPILLAISEAKKAPAAAVVGAAYFNEKLDNVWRELSISRRSAREELGGKMLEMKNRASSFVLVNVSALKITGENLRLSSAVARPGELKNLLSAKKGELSKFIGGRSSYCGNFLAMIRGKVSVVVIQSLNMPGEIFGGIRSVLNEGVNKIVNGARLAATGSKNQLALLAAEGDELASQASSSLSSGLEAAVFWKSALFCKITETAEKFEKNLLTWREPLGRLFLELDAKVLMAEEFVEKIKALCRAVCMWGINLPSQIAENWQNFIQPNEEISPEALAQIRQAIADEISRNLSGLSVGAAQTEYGTVVVPSTGSVADDERLKQELRGQFSDDVKIEFDKSGKAGVITPIFRDGTRGDDYVFMLTPINK